MIQNIENENINSDDVIMDMRRVAQKLNSNMLSSSEYIENDGKYSLSIFADDFGSFSNYCELAGLKYKTK